MMERDERELRPRKASMPSDEMGLNLKSKKRNERKGKKEKGKSSRRKERLEKTPSLRTVNPLL